jgi:hypothetical protein
MQSMICKLLIISSLRILFELILPGRVALACGLKTLMVEGLTE